MSLDRLINLAKKTGDRLIIHDPIQNRDLVIMDITAYEKLLDGATSSSDEVNWEDNASPWHSAKSILNERYTEDFWDNLHDEESAVSEEEIVLPEELPPLPTPETPRYVPVEEPVREANQGPKPILPRSENAEPIVLDPSTEQSTPTLADEPLFYEEPV